MIKKNAVLLGVTIVIIGLLPLSSMALPLGDPPNFDAGIRLQDSGGDLGREMMDQYSVPCIADWNEDGKKDLLVGYFILGPVYLYLNSGTNNAPTFTTYTKLQADGADISMYFS